MQVRLETAGMTRKKQSRQLKYTGKRFLIKLNPPNSVRVQ